MNEMKRSRLPRSGHDLLTLPVLGWRELLARWTTYGVVVFVVVLWVIVVVGRISWNGDVYGLDYSLWFPDGTYYAYKAFVWGGIDPQEATILLNDMYGNPDPPIPSGVPEKPPIYDSRILYSLLSAPFVSFMGPVGLLVVSAAGLLLCVAIPTVMLLRRGLVLAGLVTAGLALASTSLARWTVANLTEGLLVGLIALMLPLLPWKDNRIRWWKNAALAALAVAIALTRQSLPIVVLMVSVPWVIQWIRTKRWKNSWLGSTVSVTAPSILMLILTSPRDGFWLLPISQDAGGLRGLSATERILQVPVEIVRMTVIEVGQLGVLDRALLVLLLLALIGAIWMRWFSVAWTWVGIAMGSVFVTAWVGASGVNFRYALPLVPISILVAGSLFHKPPKLEHAPNRPSTS